MINEISQTENATKLRYPESIFEATTEYSDQMNRRYQFVCNGATGHMQPWASEIFEDQRQNVLIMFGNAIALTDAVSAENTANFSSINKSKPDIIIPREVEEQLEHLCLTAHDDQFEPGVESRFSEALQRLCAYYPVDVLQFLRTRLTDDETSPEVLSEILRWSSRQETGVIRALVIDLIVTGLHHASSLVRDAAALALAYLDEHAAVAYLQKAIERETVPELREDLRDLLHSLES